MQELLALFSPPSPDDRALLIAVVGAVVTYIGGFYLFSPTAPWLLGRDGDADERAAVATIRARLGRGTFWTFGCVLIALALGLAPAELGVALGDPTRLLLALVVPAALILPPTWASMRKPTMWGELPEVRARDYRERWLRRSHAAWLLHLVGYELIFRGVLLFFLLRRFGVWPALALTTAIYVLAHMNKAWPETAGSVMMGFVFGGMTIYSGSILPAVLLHIAIAIGSEHFAARFNPYFGAPVKTPTGS